MDYSHLKQTDPENFKLLQAEIKRENETLNLIASENYPSPAVLEALGSVFNNKYSEGYPGKRYYAGNSVIDQMEELAKKRLLQIYVKSTLQKYWHANVQPLSGATANIAAYTGLLDKGDKILALDLSQGGHLTHGSRVNFSGIFWNFVYYGVDCKTELLDYDEIEKIALKEKPKMIVCGATAYSRTIDFERFSKIAEKVNALLLADIAHIAGLIAAGVHPSPIPFADVTTSTTQKTLRGPRGGFIICKRELADKIDKAVFPGLQGGPHMHSVFSKSVCFKEALDSSFKIYAKQIIKNAQTLAQTLKNEGLEIITGGTDNHLFLLNLKPLNLDGISAQNMLETAGITLNRNAIPYDTCSPFNPSGLRLGTPALTSRGMEEKEMKQVGTIIARILNNKKITESDKKEIKVLALKFPLPY
ncbi:MAG: serine hydroxymethyltransferase [Patescibacteria group bacterium]|nr:serine hydroxymethyltransferase [Patescibacteria group bacterium]